MKKENKTTEIEEIEKNKEIIKYITFLFVGLACGLILSIFLRGEKYTNNISSDKFSVLNETYNTLKEKYYKDIDEEKLVNGAIEGMMGALGDKHSMFFDPDEKKSFEEELAGEYYGIGAEIRQLNEEEVVINRIFDDSPAEKAGLKAGDKFVSIDGEETKGKTVNEIASTLKSNKKEESVVVINRDGEEISFDIKKDNVTLLSVASEKLDNNIGYIAISLFGENTYNQFNEALTNLENDGIDSLIIDLRGNSGGYLSIVSRMISEFVDSDTTIYKMKTRDIVEEYKSLNDIKRNYKIVILVNEESASASEIMASALQEQYGAILVGKKTYGKGTVQETKILSNDTLIKYTIQEWLTSNGKSINEKGIEPDVEVDLSEEYMNNPVVENDNQLQKAIEILSE